MFPKSMRMMNVRINKYDFIEILAQKALPKSLHVSFGQILQRFGQLNNLTL